MCKEPFPIFLTSVHCLPFVKRGWLKIKKSKSLVYCLHIVPVWHSCPDYFGARKHLEIAPAINYSSSSNMTLLVTWGNGACWLWYKTSQRTCASHNTGTLTNRMSYCSLALISAQRTDMKEVCRGHYIHFSCNSSYCLGFAWYAWSQGWHWS